MCRFAETRCILTKLATSCDNWSTHYYVFKSNFWQRMNTYHIHCLDTLNLLHKLCCLECRTSLQWDSNQLWKQKISLMATAKEYDQIIHILTIHGYFSLERIKHIDCIFLQSALFANKYSSKKGLYLALNTHIFARHIHFFMWIQLERNYLLSQSPHLVINQTLSKRCPVLS